MYLFIHACSLRWLQRNLRWLAQLEASTLKISKAGWDESHPCSLIKANCQQQWKVRFSPFGPLCSYLNLCRMTVNISPLTFYNMWDKSSYTRACSEKECFITLSQVKDKIAPFVIKGIKLFIWTWVCWYSVIFLCNCASDREAMMWNSQESQELFRSLIFISLS